MDGAKEHELRLIRTAIKGKRQWLENIRENRPRIKNDLADLWNDKIGNEIISIAAGPSLENDLDKIRDIRAGKELVVADAAYHFCVDSGLNPDYVISTDASEKITEFLKSPWHVSNPSKLILNVIANPRIARLWSGDIFWFVMANQFYDKDNKMMIQDMHQIESGIGTVLCPGGNVSSVALSFALSVRNAKFVYLFGHDFCWKEKMYAGNTMGEFEKERVSMEGRAGTIFKMKNTKGEEVQTTLSLKKYAEWHDLRIEENKKRIENCTSSSILKQ